MVQLLGSLSKKRRFYIELNYCKSNYFHKSARVGMSNEYSA